MSYPTLAEITHQKFGTVKVGVPFSYGSRVVQITGYDGATDTMEIQCLESLDPTEIGKFKTIKSLNKKK
jgi:hypothetical protein